MVVDFVKFGDVGVIEGLEYADLVEKAFMFLCIHVGLLDLFGSAYDPRVLSSHLIHTAETASAELAPHFILVQEASFFHLEEALPLDSDLLDHGLLLRSNRFGLSFGKIFIEVWQRRQVEEASFVGRFSLIYGLECAERPLLRPGNNDAFFLYIPHGTNELYSI